MTDGSVGWRLGVVRAINNDVPVRIDEWENKWDSARMTKAVLDDRKRVVLSTATPGAHVTVEQLDQDTWVIRRYDKSVKLKRVLIPVIERLPRDAEWEKTESKIAGHIAKRIPEPKD